MTEKEADLILLNKAPTSLVSNVFKTVVALIINDKKIILTYIYHLH